MEFEPVGIMPGGAMRIVRESPTSAYIQFKAGSVEPAHHHTFGYDLVVIKGKKKVWNITKKESYRDELTAMAKKAGELKRELRRRVRAITEDDNTQIKTFDEAKRALAVLRDV